MLSDSHRVTIVSSRAGRASSITLKARRRERSRDVRRDREDNDGCPVRLRDDQLAGESQDLEKYKQINAKLADPRTIQAETRPVGRVPHAMRLQRTRRSRQDHRPHHLRHPLDRGRLDALVDADRPSAGEQQRARDQEHSRQHDHPARPVLSIPMASIS